MGPVNSGLGICCHGYMSSFRRKLRTDLMKVENPKRVQAYCAKGTISLRGLSESSYERRTVSTGIRYKVSFTTDMGTGQGKLGISTTRVGL